MWCRCALSVYPVCVCVCCCDSCLVYYILSLAFSLVWACVPTVATHVCVFALWQVFSNYACIMSGNDGHIVHATTIFLILITACVSVKILGSLWWGPMLVLALLLKGGLNQMMPRCLFLRGCWKNHHNIHAEIDVKRNNGLSCIIIRMVHDNHKNGSSSLQPWLTFNITIFHHNHYHGSHWS
jgi:hypothetical protein